MAGINEKKYKKIRYQTQNGMKEVLFPKHVKVHEILALYIKELYGDGFFYAPISENNIINYYLICIKNDCVISPIDTIVSERMLTYLISKKENTEYDSLNITVINDDIFNAIYEEYLNQERKYKSKKMKICISISIGIFFVFIINLYSIHILRLLK